MASYRCSQCGYRYRVHKYAIYCCWWHKDVSPPGWYVGSVWYGLGLQRREAQRLAEHQAAADEFRYFLSIGGIMGYIRIVYKPDVRPAKLIADIEARRRAHG